MWIRRPPTLNPNPKSQRTNKIMIIVQSMEMLFGKSVHDSVEDVPHELQ
jgi:hypothetical protein